MEHIFFVLKIRHSIRLYCHFYFSYAYVTSFQLCYKHQKGIHHSFCIFMFECISDKRKLVYCHKTDCHCYLPPTLCLRFLLQSPGVSYSPSSKPSSDGVAQRPSIPIIAGIFSRTKSGTCPKGKCHN